MERIRKTVNKNPKVEKFVELTGNTRGSGFKTKTDFLKALEKYGFKHDTMKVKNNKVTMLITNDLDSNTLKMQKAKKLGIEVFTYIDIAEIYKL